MTQREQDGYQSLAEISPGFFNVLSARMVDAFSSATAAPLETLERRLTDEIRKMLLVAEPTLADAVHDTSRGSLIAQAYTLGQLSFAQQLTASAGQSRVQESFLRTLDETRWRPYLTELLKGDCTNVRLAKSVGEAEETVCRKIKSLRALGVTDFRKEGTFVFNFLTPAARQVLKSRQRQDQLAVHAEYAPVKSEVEGFLERLRDQQPAHMQNTPTFGALNV